LKSEITVSRKTFAMMIIVSGRRWNWRKRIWAKFFATVGCLYMGYHGNTMLGVSRGWFARQMQVAN
jgi:hypothetical protein